ncbi:GNAT family N-acetyltransferase [Rhizobium brockwellii]|jgi:RimJ/RimL family protein N-acetyltransferase|uniref:GNAT family N-acetyltransferase n=1 Tax=Rhizobium brockwellii TaxID=3019932 RepID=A0ABU3YRE4_9HYPH|nr:MULTISPECIES: GNAT family N-acetyltransferase [Rhizobium]KPN25908.1 acetyltransferase [Rhizobium brockwellii]MDV4155994.1 GNAT family N-acetyltransferase [Rhizobium brockwellii]MDV4181308.1 GNAT family N-acetyltransferase [Rhizobium brockwellii]MDV4188217.1 GNAT family N-acetyltransferase [Rhizobium brockwellii]QIO53699.1 GNAT family N-acetyltransferase [Rhizobium leguminosarum bv. trifolii]
MSNVEKTMIIELMSHDFEALLKGVAPGQLRLVQDSAIAPPEILAMLSRLAADIGVEFLPSAWMIVEDDEIVGLCSVIKVPQDGKIHIGYGVAPTRQSRGCTTRAIGQLLEWARDDPRVALISAETGFENVASQRVLERNGFVRIGERIDAEDGPLICWEAATV